MGNERGRGGRGRGRGHKRGHEGGRGHQDDNKRGRYLAPRGFGPAIPNMPGVCITCDGGWEDRTAGEVLALIEEHYDKLAKALPPGAIEAAKAAAEASAASTSKAEEEEETQSTEKAPKEGDGGSKDISTLIAEEVAELKDKSKKRFLLHHTGVKGCVYICFPRGSVLPTPEDVVSSICEEACTSKVMRSRHAGRLLPITHSCFASIDAMKALAPKVLKPQFPDDGEPVEFAVEYEHRNAEKFDRMEVINAFVNCIKTPPHKVNLTKPIKVVLVQLTKNACGVSVTTRYREFNKFNLGKCAEVQEEGEEKKDKEPKGGEKEETTK